VNERSAESKQHRCLTNLARLTITFHRFEVPAQSGANKSSCREVALSSIETPTADF
jgi:hypothetical protein